MEPKTYLGRYRITLDQYGQPIRLRRDGNAVTYKGFDAESSREVALEIIPTGRVRISVQSKLQDESEAAKRLQQINIPTLYDFGIEDNELIYVMEMVDGVSAQEWVTTHGPMPIGSALRIAAQIVNALGAATFHGIFHHALNPGNIMIVPGQTAEGEWPLIKVLNFTGLAPNYSRADASAAGVADSINFVAPEQLENGAADFPSEIYSLGSTLWFLLSGVPPLAGATTVESANRVPTPVRHLIAQMLAADPRERPLDPVVLHEKIEDCIAEVENKRVVLPTTAAPVAAPIASVAPAAATIDPRPRRPFPWQPLAVAAVLLLLGTLAAMVVPRVFHSRSARQEIGVPVGVPDSVAARSANVATPAPSASTASVVTNNVTPATAPSSGTLVSTAGVSEDAESTVAPQFAASSPAASPQATTAASAATRATAAPVVASNSPARVDARPQSIPADQPTGSTTAYAATAEPTATASNQTPAATTSSTKIASNSLTRAEGSEPVPPSEGPAESSADQAAAMTASNAHREETQPPAQQQPVTTRIEPSTRTAHQSAPAPATKKPVVAAAAKAAPRPKAPKNVVSSGRMRNGNVRAQYLGTTPEGELIFGLPSDERGYLTPGRNKRRTTVRPAEPPDGLPVLPALPPDQ
ncbi:MAG: protein kinase [Verrucomicrobiota bacterium]|nr:protein kinase [Verrucomicrobiota bacterium]